MQKDRTNAPDWSALIPVLPTGGPRRRALYAELRRLIEAGTLPPGTKLPPTRDLAARLGLARGAAVAAFEMLVADGFAEARVGAGTHVAAAVPRLGPAPPPPPQTARPGQWADGPVLPGMLGVAIEDRRSLAILRGLLQNRLARMDPRFFLAYGDPQGDADLRRAVADYLRLARGVRCHAGQVVLTTGTQQGLYHVATALLPRGGTVWIEDPGYHRAAAALTAAGLRLAGVPVDAEGLDPAAGIDRAPTAVAAYVTPSHQFPLGVTLTMPRRLALIDWARRADALILEDDYDSEFRYAGTPLTALQGIDDHGRVIYLGTFSKVIAPGLRLGYVVVPERLLDPLIALRERLDRPPSTLATAALAEFIEAGHFSAHLRRARRTARAARDTLVAGLRTGPVAVDAPDQGLHLIARLPGLPHLADAELAGIARAAGLGGRRLSTLYRDSPPEQGLVLGFSGFPLEALRQAAETFARSLNGIA